MNIDQWFEWPTKSSSPYVNLAVAVTILLTLAIALTVSIVIAVPLGIGVGLFKWAQWRASRPVPTAQIQAAADQRVIAANFPEGDAFAQSYIRRLYDAWRPELPSPDIFETLGEIAETLYEAEGLNNPLPPAPIVNGIEEGRHRDRLLAHMRKCQDAPGTLATFTDTLSRSLTGFRDALPPLACVTPQEFIAEDRQPLATVPVIDVLPDVGGVVLDMTSPFFAETVGDLDLFTDLRRQLDRNVTRASAGTPGNKIVLSTQHKGSPHEIVHLYLQGTPFERLFEAQVPFSFADERRFEHMHVIGGSGHGKTQLLQHLILQDLQRDEPPALIVIDSQGDMLRKIQQLDLFTHSPLAGRLVIIDPEDVEHPPALNMFDMTNARLAGYSLAHREQIEAGVIELYNYIFGALAAELTQKQSTAFAYVSRLMLSMPGATIHTLRELMEDGAPSIERSPFAEHIVRLDPTAQAFFQNQFFSRAFSQTKQQIARRLYGVLQVPAFDRMFSAPRNKLDMFEAIQQGRIILVNTSKALLKTDASALFGRYMIALAMKAAFERVAVTNRNPAFLIVDEAAEYFDENLEALLSQARKFNMGVLFAHQHLDQLSPALRSSVAANTSIKLAGGIADRDARALAPDMRTTAEFISSTRKYPDATEFACYIRNVTDNAVRLQIPFGTLEAAPCMSSEQAAELLAQNRARYAAHPDTARPAAANPGAPPPVVAAHARTEAEADDWRS